ncbi:alpha/beta hydrolase [Halopiger xanaduensis]|uniref:Triacylglycerol lipase n=1 Tax=Halopiger xanaduensis (strain DSM 18323 / JCM 14033 / SH-6) TaxID=797210 RepID=F8D9F8_HALXS|nr:alpha/beta hydrolase [Halopiger xanaduensis]AEH36900.1 Triacylglycerol lipase [Halopiger xanaduensis SH-6]
MTPQRADEPHPDVQRFLERYESIEALSFDEGTVEDARGMFEKLRSGEPVVDLESVEDRAIEGPRGDVPIRVYEPGTDGEERPLVLYFHGGGWVVGSVDTHDDTCRKFADETGYPVVSVDYGLAPEYPFPEGLLDCYAALEWAAEAETAAELRADPDRLVLAGDSAGGNLAAATALLARDRGGPDVAYQVLLYPVTGDPRPTDAFEENAEGYFLSAADSSWFERHYFARDVDRGNVYALPRRAHDLSDLPPATVVTAGFDPLRDDGAAYAERLEEAGVPVSYHNYEDMIHGFFGMISAPVDVDVAHEAYARVAADLESALE